ncbi:hypothetical protein DL771_001490 [Monosporascus sp. 5C6A]|nr:hypothetical protein DL771_001490 [Monosporascus sp. 5C6A]
MCWIITRFLPSEIFVPKIHRKLELELEAAEEEADQVNARLRRLRKQKRMWYEKMMKAVTRGIDNLEELERLEREETGEQEPEVPSLAAQASVSTGWSGIDATDWSTVDDVDWGALMTVSGAVGESPSESAGRS